MFRRDFIAAGSGLVMGAFLPEALEQNRLIYSGWVPNKRATKDFKRELKPFFAQQGKDLAGTGRGKKALLWKFFENVSEGKLIPHDQGGPDCVSHAWGLGVDILDCIQIAHGSGEWQKKCATEIIYAGGRIEVGKGAILTGGMHCSWAGRWCRDFGILLRQPYLDGKYDFTNYSASKARKWAHKCNNCTTWGGGVPDELEPLAKKHPVKTITLIKTWEEARDAIYNGYPIAICSKYGFKRSRDKDGFSERFGIWAHSMILAGMDDSNSRPGGLIINSIGSDWIDGPTRLDQPIGSFWVDAKTINGMLAQEDSFAMSNYVGYPRQNLDYTLY